MIESEREWVDGWLEEFVYCSPRVTASGKDPTRTLTGPSRGPNNTLRIIREKCLWGAESALAVIGTGGPVK
eukprot:1179620-Prorocentrum_minimum.AAC.3